MAEHRSCRRRFLVQLALAAGTLPGFGELIAHPANAASPKLPATNAQAKALAYIESASAVQHALFRAGSTCSNCQLFTAGSNACAIFPGFAVAPAGWCSAWTKRA